MSRRLWDISPPISPASPVFPGDLIALPLKLVQACASPVRAVLRAL